MCSINVLNNYFFYFFNNECICTWNIFKKYLYWRACCGLGRRHWVNGNKTTTSSIFALCLGIILLCIRLSTGRCRRYTRQRSTCTPSKQRTLTSRFFPVYTTIYHEHFHSSGRVSVLNQNVYLGLVPSLLLSSPSCGFFFFFCSYSFVTTAPARNSISISCRLRSRIKYILFVVSIFSRFRCNNNNKCLKSETFRVNISQNCDDFFFFQINFTHMKRRRVSRISWTERVTNEEVYRRRLKE